MSVPPDRQIRMTRKPVRGDLLAGSLETNVGDPLKQLLEEDARFEPRQMRAEAKVWTLPETEVRIVRASRKEALRFGKFPLIAVCRDEINNHFVARPDRRPCEFNLCRRRALCLDQAAEIVEKLAARLCLNGLARRRACHGVGPVHGERSIFERDTE